MGSAPGITALFSTCQSENQSRMNSLLAIILAVLLGLVLFVGLCCCLVFLSCCCLNCFMRSLHMYPDWRHPQYQREEAQGRSAAATLGDTTATGYECDDVAEDRSSGSSSSSSRSRGRSGDACADEAAPVLKEW